MISKFILINISIDNFLKVFLIIRIVSYRNIENKAKFLKYLNHIPFLDRTKIESPTSDEHLYTNSKILRRF